MEFKQEDIVFWKQLPKGILGQHVLWKSKKQNGLILNESNSYQINSLLNFLETEYWGIGNKMMIDYLEFTFRQLSFEEKLMGFWIKPKKPRTSQEFKKEDVVEPKTIPNEQNEASFELKEDEVKLVLHYDEVFDDIGTEFKTNHDETLITSPNSSFVKTLDGYYDIWKPEIFDQEGNTLFFILWNTGLYSKTGEEVHCLLMPNLMEADPCPFYLRWFLRENELKKLFLKDSIGRRSTPILLKYFQKIFPDIKEIPIIDIPREFVPKKAWYYNHSPDALFYNHNIPVNMENFNNREIYKHKERFSVELLKYDSKSLNFLVEKSLLYGKANPRKVLNCWLLSHQSADIGLVFPVFAKEDTNPKFALILALEKDVYQIRFICSLERAYMKARVLGKVDGTWLKIFPDSNQENLIPNIKKVIKIQILSDQKELKEYLLKIVDSNRNIFMRPPSKSSSVKELIKYVLQIKPNWKKLKCTHYLQEDLPGHNSRPWTCLFSHGDEEQELWNNLRKIE